MKVALVVWFVVLGGPFSQEKFIPDISLIGDFSCVWRSEKEINFPGEFEGVHHEDHTLHAHEGFNFNYAELTLYAPADPYFDLQGVFSFTLHGVEVEELYFTFSPGAGINVKGGRFKSSFGRLNSKHAHTWDFATLPAVYRLFFGHEGLTETGIQVEWVFPLPFYLVFGLEVLEGANEVSFGWKGFQVNGSEVKDAPLPNLYVGYIKGSADAGNFTLLTGLSAGWGRHRRPGEGAGESAGGVFIGDFELTAKYFFDAYRTLSFQGEFLIRRMKGLEWRPSDVTEFRRLEGGFFAEVVWRFARRWRAGVRFESLYGFEGEFFKGNVENPFLAWTGMTEFNPTEFSRLRVQYSWYGIKDILSGTRKNIHEIILQVNISIGAHGAHPF